jgi:hypothetical protein
MANHLKAAAIQTLLGDVAANITIGDLVDLIEAMQRIHITRGPDHDRSMESSMSTIFTSTVQP